MAADLISLVLGSAGSLGAVWLGSRFAEVKRVREQAWDRKALAYSDILDAMNEMRRYLDGEYSALLLRRERSTADSQNRSAIYRAAVDQLGKATSRQSWLLPEQVQVSIARLEAVLAADYETWQDDLDASSHACGIALQEVRSLARADMAAPRLIRKQF